MEFEATSQGLIRYSNHSNYRQESHIIRKQVYTSPLVVDTLKSMISSSEIMKEDDKIWPLPDKVGRQELEILFGDEHVKFVTGKIGSLAQVEQSQDKEGLTNFYYLVQDLKALIFCLVKSHFKIKPI